MNNTLYRSARTDALSAIDSIKNAIQKHNVSLTKAYKTYRETVNHYKSGDMYAKEYADKKIAEAAASARVEVEAADITLHSVIRANVPAMSAHCNAMLKCPPDLNFVKAMELYRDFDIPMTVQEAKVHALDAADSIMGMRILQKVASKNGIKVNVVDGDTYFNDIKAFERVTPPTQIAPEGFEHEYAQLFQQVTYKKPNGEVDFSTAESPADVAMHATLSRQVMQRLADQIDGEIIPRWEKSCAPVVEENEIRSELEHKQRKVNDMKIEEDTLPGTLGFIQEEAEAVRAANAIMKEHYS